jgi:hypothetical protein
MVSGSIEPSHSLFDDYGQRQSLRPMCDLLTSKELKSFITQRDDRLDACGPARGNPPGDSGHGAEPRRRQQPAS